MTNTNSNINKKRIFRYIRNIILILLLIPIVTSLLLQIPSVQTFIAKKVSSYIADKTDTKVTLKKVDVSITKGIQIVGLLVQSSANDTLINSGKIDISLLNNLFSIRNSKLNLNSFKLSDTRLNLIVKKGDKQSSLEEMIAKLVGEGGPAKESTPFLINIKNISVDRFALHYIDENTNKSASVGVQNLTVRFDTFDLQKNTFSINKLKLIKPEINIVNSSVSQIEIAIDKGAKPIKSNAVLRVASIEVNDGKIEYNHLDKPYKSSSNFDPNHFGLSQFSGNLESLNYVSNSLKTKINSIKFIDKNKWLLESLKVDQLIASDELIVLSQFEIKTKKSSVKNNIILKPAQNGNYSDFVNKVAINAQLVDTYIDIDDISYFVGALQNSALIKNLKDNKFTLNTTVDGTVNNLRLKDLFLRLDETTFVDGGITLKNITNPTAFAIGLNFNQLHTNINRLKNFFPDFKPSAELKRLGDVDFSGSFEIRNNSYKINGELATNLGSSEVNIDIKKQAKLAYEGKVVLKQFELGKFLNRSDLGTTSLVLNTISGNGFDLSKDKLFLDGIIQSLTYKGYTYSDIVVDGALNGGSYEGKLNCNDPNLDLEFDGFVNTEDGKYSINAYTDIQHLDLKALKLTNDEFTIEGKVTLDGSTSNIDDFEGTLQAKSIIIIRRDSIYKFGALNLNSIVKEDKSKILAFTTDGIKINLDGFIAYRNVFGDVKSLIATNFPYYTKTWNVKPSTNKQQFNFDLDIKQLSPFDELIGIKDLSFNNIRAKGLVNSEKNELQLVGSFPKLAYQSNVFYNGNIYLNLLNKSGDISIHSDSSMISKYLIKNYDISSKIIGDKISFDLESKNPFDSIDLVKLTGELTPHPQGYEIKVLTNELRLYNKRWKLNPDNVIAIGKNYIDLNNVVITDGKRTIEMDDIANRGVVLRVNRFKFEAINPIIKNSDFYLDGEVISSVKINDIFEASPDIYGTLLINGLTINGDPYGDVNLDVSKPLNKNLIAILSIDHQATKQAIKANISYDPTNKQVDAALKGRKVPIKWLKYVLKDGISNLNGYLDIDGTVTGFAPNLKIDADGTLRNGSVKVTYLGETYKFNNQKIKITERNIDLTGGQLTDSEGNVAILTGGIPHKLLRNFGLDVNIESPRFIAINTTKKDNPIYYGVGKGNINIDIFGQTVDRVDMTINATTGPGTVMNIPITAASVTSNKNIITFINKESYFNSADSSQRKLVKIQGLNIETNLVMTNDAQVNMIYDESIGDVIRGRGNGNMRIISPRVDPLEIYGQYEIEQGEYLFTVLGTVAKPFTVKRGGTLRWTGDPINALINIEANYPVRTSLSTFLQEFLYSQQLQSRALTRTPVNVKLLIGNTLYNPSISFDLDFPEVIGELKNYALTKTRLLKANEADFNGQIFSLIIWNAFLPSNAISDLASNNGLITSAGINTISEFISSQVSLVVTGLINSALGENGLISGLDFNLNLRNNRDFAGLGTTSNTSGLLPSEIELRLNPKFKFLDQRLEMNLGGNYVLNNGQTQTNIPTNQNYIVPDFYIQYALNDDRSLNLKVYGRYDFDEINLQGRRQIYGLGIRFRTEFGSMLETKTDLKDYFKNRITSK